MLHYLKASFYERWKMFVVVILILLLIGTGFIGSLAVTDRMNLQARTDLEANWRYHYDILVLPEEVKGNNVLGDGWVPPQSSIAGYGGITIEDLEIIRQIPGVKIAAPIAKVGYHQGDYLNVVAKDAEPGEFYEVNVQKMANDGINDYIIQDSHYITNYYSPEFEESLLYQKFNQERNLPEWYQIRIPPTELLRYPNELLVVAIDPEAEEQLFSFHDSTEEGLSVLKSVNNSGMMPEVSFLALNSQLYDYRESISIKRFETPDEVTEADLQNGVDAYLQSLPQTEIVSLELETLSPEWRNVNGVLHVSKDEITKELYSYGATLSSFYKYGQLSYEIITQEENSIPTVFAKQFNPPSIAEFSIDFPSYRQKYGEDHDSLVAANIVGFYDATKVQSNFNPVWKEGEPLDIYTPHHSVAIFDGAGEPLNPTQLKPLPLKYAYYTGAPDLLTSLSALRVYYKDDPPLSSIRVVVDGVEKRTEESQRIIEQVATDIMDKTGHHVEIMLGSVGEKIHVHLEGTGANEVGVVEEVWQRQGVSWSIEQRLDEANKWLFLYLFLIGFVFIYTVTTHSLLKRSAEFSILRSFGWSRKRILFLLCLEITLLATVSTSFMFFVNLYMNILSTQFFFVIWIAFFLIIGLGYWSGSYRALKHSPRYGLAGEVMSQKSRSLLPIRGLGSYVLHQMVRKPLRFGLLVGTIGLTLYVGVLYLAAQSSMEQFLFLSVLGEAINLHMAPYQKLFLIGGLILTILCVFFLLFLNVTDRKKELLIMRSIGWSLTRIQLFLCLEVALIGLIGSLLGVGGSVVTIVAFTTMSVPVSIALYASFVTVFLLLLFIIILTGTISLRGMVRDQHAA
ncbi:FtsX-like permease family protein [Sutcliffiella cohnii]